MHCWALSVTSDSAERVRLRHARAISPSGNTARAVAYRRCSPGTGSRGTWLCLTSGQAQTSRVACRTANFWHSTPRALRCVELIP